MKNSYFIISFLLLTQHACFSYADTVDKIMEYDTVSIGYIPSRGAYLKGEPPIIIEAKTLSRHKNKDIKHFYIKLSNLASEGRADNATQFHEPTQYIEVIYQGERTRLFYSGDSKLDKFNRYEKHWKLLHNEIYTYLDSKISPDNQFSSAEIKSTAPVH